MKTLKLNHTVAEALRKNAHSSTWRIYDDKDIRVNDKIELIDKVDPHKPESWRSVGTARVDAVEEKRLEDFTKTDLKAHSFFGTHEEMLKTSRSYYGSSVSFETPVKIIRFTLLEDQPENTPGLVRLTLKEAKLYADGGSRGNPGPSASGFAIMNMDDQVVVKKGIYLGITTNNQAEYQALRLGLKEAQAMGVRDLHIYLDSLLVVNQMRGIFKVKNRDLWPIHESIKQMLPMFHHVSFTHVPRELNKIADSAVNEALDEAVATQ